MSLGKWVFDDYGVPFITLRPEQTLGEARTIMQAKGYVANHTFLVCREAKENIWRAARFIDVLHQDSDDPLLLSLEMSHLPLRLVDEVVSTRTHESSDDVVDRLLRYARQVFVITDEQGEVVGVLTNTEMGADDSLEPVHFTAIHPHSVAAGTQSKLLVYAHLENVRNEILEHAKNYVPDDGKARQQRTARLKPQLKYGTKITVVVETEDNDKAFISFKETCRTLSWDSDWELFPFSFTANENAAGQDVTIHLSVQIAGNELAAINVPVEIVQRETPVVDPVSTNARIHQKIFISYAREDTNIVRRYYEAQVAAANEVFLDVESIRSGEGWRKAVKAALNEVDFVQLFWSEHSANSHNVRFEWEYFINNCCPNGDCKGRLKPVYWKEPLFLPIPQELRGINFRFAKFDD